METTEMGTTEIPLLQASAQELQEHLTRGASTSFALTKLFLEQIARGKGSGLWLNALISVAPSDMVLDRARCLQAERSAGHIRDRFHGIPIVLKVRM
jgi:amidase